MSGMILSVFSMFDYFAVKFRGRMGNQLFQAAFLYSQNNRSRLKGIFLAEKAFVLDTYFNYPWYFSLVNGFRSIVFRLIFRGSFYKPLVQSAEMQEKLFAARGITYQGFFQSTFYFDRDLILNSLAFKVRQRVKHNFEGKFRDLLRSKLLTVHVRRSDYRELRKKELNFVEATLPMDYYSHALQKLGSASDQVLILTDDLTEVKELLPIENARYMSNHFMEDFLLMQYSPKLIISNSTFSWWAAFLNTVPDVRVIAPKYFLGYNAGVEYPRGIEEGTGWEWIHHEPKEFRKEN